MTCFNIPILPLGIIVAFLAPILSPKGVFAAPTAANRMGVDLLSPSTARGLPELTLPVVRTGAGSYQVDDPSCSPSATDAGIRGDSGEEGINGVEQMERRDEIFNPLLKSRAATHKRYRALLVIRCIGRCPRTAQMRFFCERYFERIQDTLAEARKLRAVYPADRKRPDAIIDSFVAPSSEILTLSTPVNHLERHNTSLSSTRVYHLLRLAGSL
ncbi:hypothetical protein EV361DRAFT_947256 [Lentinula raphanica]|uniref:Transmembrane protein n=1 Tax=Lentinula raphanica TaxID=153919 RepID=A0AA38PA91_9AGAR|nr:hypothetical protein F5878DRAFT_660681 [Lentinula raphanica]KAJ3974199.1 hypothetical protein EV361DRAFT_947256 [Lentinula raphanica]